VITFSITSSVARQPSSGEPSFIQLLFHPIRSYCCGPPMPSHQFDNLRQYPKPNLYVTIWPVPPNPHIMASRPSFKYSSTPYVHIVIAPRCPRISLTTSGNIPNLTFMSPSGLFLPTYTSWHSSHPSLSPHLAGRNLLLQVPSLVISYN
jgi:hypothetical protein